MKRNEGMGEGGEGGEMLVYLLHFLYLLAYQLVVASQEEGKDEIGIRGI